MKNKSTQNGLKLYGIMALSCAAVFALITLVLEPLSVLAASDITVSVTFIPTVIDILRELAENVGFALCYSIVIYAAVKRSSRHAWGLFGIYSGACAIRRLLVLGISFITYSYVDTTDIFSVCIYFALDVLMMLTVTLISVVIGKTYRARLAETEKAARITGDLNKIEGIKFSSVYSKRNPMQTCALLAGIMLSVMKLVMRIDFDIKYTKFYGAPSGIGEILIMVVYYFSDVLVCVIFYALAWLILSRLLKKDTAC